MRVREKYVGVREKYVGVREKYVGVILKVRRMSEE